MDAAERREAILTRLSAAAAPVAAWSLGERLGVSRQVIVGDVALLRAAGHAIRATNRGYILARPTDRPRRSIAVQHTRAEIPTELSVIVEAGGTVLDVSVEHRLYGQITVDLLIGDTADLTDFLSRLPESSTLAELTNGWHTHTIEADSEQLLDEIEARLGAALPGALGEAVILMGRVASSVTGAGIGLGTAHRLGAGTLVLVGAGTAGPIGAHASSLLAGTAVVTQGAGTSLLLRGPGEPLGAFLAAWAAFEVGRLVAGRTPVDILVTPLATVFVGGSTGLLVGPPISQTMTALGHVINWGTERQPLLMGVVVSVIMGMVLTLPISSAALGVILGLSGTAAGAATIGCTAQMVGFAVASFRDNRWSGLLAQGLGTSMLQVPNIMRRPLIWVPPTLASAILGPVSTVVLRMESNAVGSGMGSAGLVGQIMTWQVMSPSVPAGRLALTIALFHVAAPAALSWGICALMRRRGWIRPGDMALARA
ncbi:MAG: PTS sugar transporter subunit IIC [Actinomyces sp.]|uniref:PTS sugar transporter subunit IIC n=1 Tax=Actinomyces sp. TaxID=29317 RepID=UPI0026DAB782|nr:PTS sugar transporter subunit IIC [Actinomyces sp.]MDO4243631.1 PTS sugar transporter subunit IIC [Actinomyces sp.]